jgi:hypothetical protein
LYRGFLDEEGTNSRRKNSADAAQSAATHGGKKAGIISAAAEVVRETQCGYVSVATKSGFSFV